MTAFRWTSGPGTVLRVVSLVAVGGALSWLGPALANFLFDQLSAATPVGLLIEGAAMGVLGFITYVFARRFEPRIPVVLLSVALGNALTVLLIAFTGGQGYFQPTTLPWVALYTLLTFASALGATTASLLELSRQSD